eukprot:gb/GECG01016360.1/.p1 GENE.gb/GECG01016360.1/~~gb/GECG01016360.1/.p1  ORF type:complete len:118 (+),score=6.00 gb/GECG01016360.1/:1-354(+)
MQKNHLVSRAVWTKLSPPSYNLQLKALKNNGQQDSKVFLSTILCVLFHAQRGYITDLDDTELLPNFCECINSLIKLLISMSSRDLGADTGLPAWYNRVRESYDVNALLQQLIRHLGG